MGRKGTKTIILTAALAVVLWLSCSWKCRQGLERRPDNAAVEEKLRFNHARNPLQMHLIPRVCQWPPSF